MSFPVTKLRPKGGFLYGHVFENERTGLARNVYWSVSIEFAPLRYAGQSWNTSMTAEWLVWPVKRWLDLDGADLGKLSDPALAEASFYLTEHQAGQLERLRLSRTGERTFEVDLSLAFDLVDPAGGVTEGVRLARAGQVRFDGVYVIPENLTPMPASKAAAAKVLSQLIRSEDFEPPTWQTSKYVFAPKRVRKR